MPRSAFQGTFQSGIRPTIATAPDAMVLLNGSPDLTACPNCNRTFDLSAYITSIQVDLSVDSPPGSASITLSIPRHAIDDFYFDETLIIAPMMEVEIFAKGYFLLNGLGQYYPIFWGLVTEVSDNYGSGEHTVTIQCADILKWWECTRMCLNPAFTAPVGSQGRSIFGNVFAGMNPYDVIFSLAQMNFGDVVVGSGSLTSIQQENKQASTFNYALTDIALYWQDRFTRIRSNLLLFGVNGTAVRGDSIPTQYQKNAKSPGANHWASAAVRRANGGDTATQMVFDPSNTDPSKGPTPVAYRTNFTQAGVFNLWQSEFQTKLEIANAAKEAIGFELYMDVTGDIVFKPPFYNLNVLNNKPVSWIQDIDIIDWAFSESEAEVVTQLQIQGNFGGSSDFGVPEDLTPHTSVTDYHLLRQYGWRPQQLNSEFMGDSQVMYYQALDTLDRLNSRRHRASITIPMRPELRLGFPVYVASKDSFWYVTGISHNIQFGGRATTTISCTAKRKKFIAPQGVGTLTYTAGTPPPGGVDPKTLAKSGTFNLDLGGSAQLPADPTVTDLTPYTPMVLHHPKTGRIVGFPNAVMVYTRPFKPDPTSAQVPGQKQPGTNSRVDPAKLAAYTNRAVSTVQTQLKAIDIAAVDATLREKYHNNRYSYGLNTAGVYIYAYDQQFAINQFVLLPVKNITVKGASSNPQFTTFTNSSALIRPVSDENGFEVVGHFRYGRGVALTDGLLSLTSTANVQAQVGEQVALSGTILDSLIAQSQGLTSLTTTYVDPAQALATMSPDDLQTAGVQLPGQSPQFVVPTPGTVQVSSGATLGSQAQSGVSPTSGVEATQLSQALTLSAMTIRENVTSATDDCSCLLDRSDLAFMSSGYQVKTLNPIAPDTSSLFGNPSPNGAVSQPVAGTPTSFDQVRSTVESFLFTLYSALDAPHQQYEAALRGQMLETAPVVQPLDVSLFSPPPAVSNFAPPFSSINQAALGNVAAIVQQATSSEQGLANDWDSFGQNLKNTTELTSLQGDLANQQKLVSQLTQQLEQLQAGLTPGSGVTVAGDSQSQITDLQNQIAKANQQIANDQAQIANIQAQQTGF